MYIFICIYNCRLLSFTHTYIYLNLQRAIYIYNCANEQREFWPMEPKKYPNTSLSRKSFAQSWNFSKSSKLMYILTSRTKTKQMCVCIQIYIYTHEYRDIQIYDRFLNQGSLKHTYICIY
jgi:hypothetical protein